jgi:GT2 family glycosyltransferase
MPKPINTFIIPCLNNLDGLRKLVWSLYKYTPHNFQVFVIFNGTFGDFQIAQQMFPGNEVHLWIKGNRNFGFAKSMNMGIKLAQTEYITLANDDVEVIYPTWWEEVEALFHEKPTLGAFNPHSFINKRHTGDRAIQYDIKDEYTQEDIEAMKKVFHAERWYSGLLCTFFTICKRVMFDKIGLLDESFGLGSGEDYDLCVRAGKAGFMLAGGSVVMVKHWWGNTKDNLPKDENFISNFDLIAKGNQHMERKWGPHSDEVKRRVADGRMTQEEADALGGGWPGGGAKEPFDKDTVDYPDGKFFQEVEI